MAQTANVMSLTGNQSALLQVEKSDQTGLVPAEDSEDKQFDNADTQSDPHPNHTSIAQTAGGTSLTGNQLALQPTQVDKSKSGDSEDKQLENAPRPSHTSIVQTAGGMSLTGNQSALQPTQVDKTGPVLADDSEDEQLENPHPSHASVDKSPTGQSALQHICMHSDHPDKARSVPIDNFKDKQLDNTDTQSNPHPSQTSIAQTAGDTSPTSNQSAQVDTSDYPDQSMSVTDEVEKQTIGIILVGKPNAGKRTLIENGLVPGLSNPKKQVRESKRDKWIFNDAKTLTLSYHIQVIEDLELVRALTKRETGGNKKLTDFMDKLPRKVSLIAFVFRQGRYTREEQDMFGLLIDSMKDEAKRLCTLVITGCEHMTEDAKEELLTEFRDSKDTQKIAASMHYPINMLCTGLPDVSKVKESLKEVFEEECKKSRIELSKLSPTKDSYSLDVDSVLPKQESRKQLSSASSSCCVM